MAQQSNAKRVDRLADIRERIRLLQAEEATLRSEIMLLEDFNGDRFRARVVEQISKHLSRKALEKRFGVGPVAQCQTKKVSTALYLSAVEEAPGVFQKSV